MNIQSPSKTFPHFFDLTLAIVRNGNMMSQIIQIAAAGGVRILGTLQVVFDFVLDSGVVGGRSIGSRGLVDVNSGSFHNEIGLHGPGGGLVKNGNIFDGVVAVMGGPGFSINAGLFLWHALGQVVGIVVDHFRRRRMNNYTFLFVI